MTGGFLVDEIWKSRRSKWRFQCRYRNRKASASVQDDAREQSRLCSGEQLSRLGLIEMKYAWKLLGAPKEQQRIWLATRTAEAGVGDVEERQGRMDEQTDSSNREACRGSMRAVLDLKESLIAEYTTESTTKQGTTNNGAQATD